MEALRSGNLALRFILELLALVALAYWGFRPGRRAALRWIPSDPNVGPVHQPSEFRHKLDTKKRLLPGSGSRLQAFYLRFLSLRGLDFEPATSGL
jgi:hypothetical protein